MMKKSIRTTLSMLAVSALAAVSPAAGADDASESYNEDLPAVPKSVLLKSKAGTEDASGAINSSGVITVQEGVNYIIPIAVSHPNRIITPFSSPEVVSTSLTGMKADGSCGEICIKDNIVYVATDKTTPVTAYLTQKGNQNFAISLTMVPQKIPPREIRLQLDESSQGGGYLGGAMFNTGNKDAEAWETSQPYIETIKNVLRAVALNQIPGGYNVRKISGNTRNLPICKSNAVSVSFDNGQVLLGHSLNVFVGVAKNETGAPVEIKESMCGGWDVAAVAAYPAVVLEPGQKTEIYVVKKIGQKTEIKNYRPSLLD